MNQEKKLEYFAQLISKEVEAKKLKARRQMAADMEKAIADALSAAETEAEQHIKNERQAIQKAQNKRRTEAKAQARRQLASLREELTAKLLEEVKTTLDDFIHSHEYESHLIDNIQTALANSKHNFTYIQLTPNDMRLSHAIQEATGLTPEVGSESAIGGFKLLSANRGIAADFTFAPRLASAADELNDTISSSL